MGSEAMGHRRKMISHPSAHLHPYSSFSDLKLSQPLPLPTTFSETELRGWKWAMPMEALWETQNRLQRKNSGCGTGTASSFYCLWFFYLIVSPLLLLQNRESHIFLDKEWLSSCLLEAMAGARVIQPIWLYFTPTGALYGLCHRSADNVESSSASGGGSKVHAPAVGRSPPIPRSKAFLGTKEEPFYRQNSASKAGLSLVGGWGSKALTGHGWASTHDQNKGPPGPWWTSYPYSTALDGESLCQSWPR